MNQFRNQLSTPSGKTSGKWKYLLAAGFFVLILHSLLGAISYNFFVALDNTFSASGANAPLLIWCGIGALLGIVPGSLIACRKYKLGTRLNFISAIPAFLVIFTLVAASGPFRQITPRKEEQLVNEADSMAIDSSVIITDTSAEAAIQHKATKKVHVETAGKEKPSQKSCEQQISSINLTIRSDSVKLFFRTTQTKGGAWSEWDSIFIPQPGQYALSGSQGKVMANSIQYYYESRQESTRSASDPFSRTLCNGSLSINTY